MWQLRSKKYPDRPPFILTDDEYEQAVKKGIAKRFVVKKVEPIKNIVKIPDIIEIKKKKVTKKKVNDK